MKDFAAFLAGVMFLFFCFGILFWGLFTYERVLNQKDCRRICKAQEGQLVTASPTYGCFCQIGDGLVRIPAQEEGS